MTFCYCFFTVQEIKFSWDRTVKIDETRPLVQSSDIFEGTVHVEGDESQFIRPERAKKSDFHPKCITVEQIRSKIDEDIQLIKFF